MLAQVMAYHPLWLVLFSATALWVVLVLRSLVVALTSGQPAKRAHSLAYAPVQVNLGDRAAVSSMQGRRPHMEDTYYGEVLDDNQSKAGFFGVYDGHGGCKASMYTALHLQDIVKGKDYRDSPEAALAEALPELDSQWLELAHAEGYDDGTTAVTALVLGDMLYVANVGDSRAVLTTNGSAYAMSDDHKPNRPDERQRIRDLGGRVVFHGTWRVEGMLALSRAIGDRRLKRFVSSVPEIKTRQLQDGDEFLILASDGVWDVVSNEDAAKIVSEAPNVRDAAEQLTNTAYKRGSYDNITTLVVDLTKFQ